MPADNPAPVHAPPKPEPPLRAALRAAGHIPLRCGNAVIVATQEANGGRVIHSQGGDRALFDLARAVMDHARSEHRGQPRDGIAAWIWCDIDGTGDRWRLALASAAQDADTLRFPFDDFEDDCANYADCPTVMIGRPAPPPRVDRPADGAAFLAMHQALRRVADLWGPAPAGDDAAPIYTAGAAFGTLGDLRAVEHALALAEGRAGECSPTPGAQHLPRLQDLIADHLGVQPHQAHPGALLVDDLGCDSLDCIELTMASEEVFGIEITDDEAEACVTVADLLALLDRKGAAPPVQTDKAAAAD